MESIVYIPRNYTDAGRIFGMFEIRNVIECVLLCFPIIILTFLSSPFGLTATIIICMVFVIPIGGFSLIGIHDYSLLTFIRLYIRWRKSRRILVYRGIKWINTRKTFETQLKNTAIRKSKGDYNSRQQVSKRYAKSCSSGRYPKGRAYH